MQGSEHSSGHDIRQRRRKETNSQTKNLTPKHIGLGSNLRHVTRSKELAHLFHKAGHILSYQQILQLDTGMAECSLKSTNPTTGTEDRTDIIYNISCAECDSSYIGETGRSLKDRLKEHKRAFRLNNPSLSAVAEHAIDTGHKIGWDDAHIIDFETYFWPRKVKEAIWITIKAYFE